MHLSWLRMIHLTSGVHCAAVVPNNRVLWGPHLRPNVFFLRCMGPELVKKILAFVLSQLHNIA